MRLHQRNLVTIVCGFQISEPCSCSQEKEKVSHKVDHPSVLGLLSLQLFSSGSVDLACSFSGSVDLAYSFSGSLDLACSFSGSLDWACSFSWSVDWAFSFSHIRYRTCNVL